MFVVLIVMGSVKARHGGEAFGGAMFGSMTGSLIAGAATRNSGGGDQSGYALKRIDRLENALEQRVQEIERFVQKSIDSLNRQMAALRKSLGKEDSEEEVDSPDLITPAIEPDSSVVVAPKAGTKKERSRQGLRVSRRERRAMRGEKN